jgi:uncharacterized membrane-anchored protein YhcB (DUF1043 family)
MNKKDFSIGLVIGFVVSMFFSFFLMNYYIEQKVDEAKESAHKKYVSLKKELEAEFKEEVESIKAYTAKKAAEKGTVLMKSASNELKKYWNKGEEKLDSLSTE